MREMARKGLDFSDKKKLLFKQILQKEMAVQQLREGVREAPPAIPARRERAHYPLSPRQRQLWLLDQLAPGEVITSAFRVAGSLDLALFRQSVQTLVERHELLRAVFLKQPGQEGEPLQRILPSVSVDVSLVDVSALDAEALQQTLATYLHPQSAPLFDLERGPLFRITLLRCADEDHFCVLALHPILADDTSLTLLCRELLTFYHDALNGRITPLPAFPLSYVDYAAWLHAYFQGARLQERQTYWQSQLTGASLSLNLPCDHPSIAHASAQLAALTRELPSALTQQCLAFCQQHDISLAHLLFTVTALLLNRYTGQDDLLLGFADTQRPPEMELLVGPFTTTLPIRLQLREGATGQQFFQDVHTTLQAAHQHGDLSLEQIVEAVLPTHDLTRSPLFQTSFAFCQFPSLSEFSAQMVPSIPTHSQQDLTFLFHSDGQHVQFTLVYHPECFEEASIARFHGHYCHLLQALVQQPAQPLATYSCLTPAEQTQLVHTWNAATLPEVVPSNQCIHHLFEQQVRRTPQAVALSDGQQRLTYLELNQRANQLARLLRRRNPGPEALVGLCLSRSCDLVIGLLAILKAGAAYVPLDPHYPHDRLAFTIEDAQVTLILTQQELVEQMPFLSELALCLDAPDLCSEEACDDLPDEMQNEQPAYVIYTSGSTGRPKGVCISHRSAVTFLHWARQEFSDEELAGVLFATSVCFDLSIFELFAPLCWGGKVILAASVLDLPQHAEREQVTLLNTVPSAAAALLANRGLPSSLLTINLAGEALPRDLVQALYRQTNVRRVCNLYGPTEDTTYSTWATIGADEPGAVTIGRPLPNTQAYIVDEQMQLVPVGVVGELYLGGAGQARGYLKRPALTAERFVPDPFGNEAGSRLYKTGDLARYRADGNLEYVGRRDYQVKVRGFRIELGEIETQLRQHPAVAEAIVLAEESASGEKSLVAYIVTREQETCDDSALRRYLQDLVPAYMVPAAFIMLKQLPQTANGKVDRKALPGIQSVKVRTGLSPAEMPQGKREQWLTRLWQEILQVSEIRRNDNFFLRGGDSLRAMRLLNRIQRDFQITLSLEDILAAPTLAQMATRLLTGTPQPTLEPIPVHREPGTSPTAFRRPLSFAQQRLWFVDQLEDDAPMYNVPLVLRLTGSLHRLALYQALRELLRRHETLRTTVQAIKGQPLAFISPSTVPDFALVDLCAATTTSTHSESEQLSLSSDVSRYLQEEVQRPFDLATGPLLRTRLLCLREDEHVLMFTMHHIITDGWSLHVFAAEFSALYNAYRLGCPSPLPELSISYGDFAAWQRAQQSASFVGESAYWKSCFSPLPLPLSLPTDQPRPLVQTFVGNMLSFQIPAALMQQAFQLTQQENVTLFMTLLSAFLVLLARYSGQEDLVVGTPVANRQRAELEGLIGFFVNTLALRADLSGNPTGRELLQRVRTLTLDAYQHQTTPFEQVVNAIQPPRDPARSPLFQVLFLLQNTPPAAFYLDDLRTRPLQVFPPTAQFDLSFILEENADGLCLNVEYNTQLFTSTTIERLQTHYQTLLAAFCRQPDRPIQEMAEYITAGEQVHQQCELEQRPGDQLAVHEALAHLREDQALTDPEQPSLPEIEEDDLLQGSVEEALGGIWQRVLGLPAVGRTENFFGLGGHSLLAMQVLAAIREELQCALSIRQFFAAPTVADLAALVERERAIQQSEAGRASNSVPALLPVGRSGDLPLSFAQQRLWFLDQLEGKNATYNIPVVLHMMGRLNIPILRHCMREVVRRHEALRTIFPRGQQTPIQCIQVLPLAPVETADFPMDGSAERQAALYQEIQAEVQRPFDLAQGPLLRTRVLRLGQDEHIVVFVMHHIISDGWSMNILAQELNALYNAFSAGQPSPLPELAIQYADFAVWQRQYLQDARLDEQLTYWKQQLSDTPTLKLPFDHPRLLTQSPSGDHCSEQWSQVALQQVLAFSQQENVTPFMTLLAGFQILLAYYSGQDDITVGTPVANRFHPALEALVGFFVNTLVLRTSLTGNPTCRAFLQRVRDVTLGAYDHQDVPFEQVVEAVHPERQPGVSPLFQVFFVLQNNATTHLSLTHLQVKTVEMHTATAKFDLAVGMEINEQGLGVGIEYNTHLFERATIRRLHKQYRKLVTYFTSHPECRLAELYKVIEQAEAED